MTRRAFDPYGNQVGPTTTGRFISVDPKLNASDPQSMTGYAYADDNPTTNSDPTGLCATMDGPSQGHPVCAPPCVLAGNCSSPLPPPAQAGASTPAHAEWAPPSSILYSPVLGHRPNKGQLTGMRGNDNYQGTDEFTWADAFEWLTQQDAVTQHNAWDMFCQTFEHLSSSDCSNDPLSPTYQGIDWSHVAESLPLFAAALALAPLVSRKPDPFTWSCCRPAS